MPCADYVAADTENIYYQGYTQTVEVTNLLVFNLKGELIHVGVNYPGRFNDTKLAVHSGLYTVKLSDMYTPPGFAVLADSAFVNSQGDLQTKVMRGRKANELWDLPQSKVLARLDILLQRLIPRVRQSAEWGLRAIKAPFGRLHYPLPADTHKRRRLLLICCHIFNLRTRTLRNNQLRSVFWPEHAT